MTDSDQRRGTGVSATRPEPSLGYELSRATRRLGRELRTRLEPFGVGAAPFGVLYELYHHDGLTQAELCARLQVEQPTMAKTLDRMDRDGLITRRPDQRDRRRSLVVLTPRAHRLRADVVAAADAGNAAALHGLDQSTIDQFFETLGQIIDNLTRPTGDDVTSSATDSDARS